MASRGVARALALLAAATALAACGTSHPASAPATTTTTTSTLPPKPTTTTTTVPPAPQASPEAAAEAFIQGWLAGKRAFSASVATTGAVDTLFAHRYGGQPINLRGCSDTFLPRVCTYGPYALGSGTLYEVDLQPTRSKWYVSAVVVEPED